MIKELLLKHRMQERQAAANAVASLNSRLPSVTSVTAVSSGETPPAQNPHHVPKKPLLSTVATARPTEVKVTLKRPIESAAHHPSEAKRPRESNPPLPNGLLKI